jgi:phosphohistidine phosphatase SixA
MKKRVLFALAALAGAASSQTLQGDAFLKALRQGGYVIVMRHARSPLEVPDKQSANPDNVKPERQLDAEGRATAAAMGEALRDLKILIGEVLSSPTYRALETVKYAQLGNARTYAELGDNGQSMQGGTEAQASWLRERVKQFPQRTNTIIVTHAPNLTRAFPDAAQGVEDGEALIFGPDGKGGAALVARVKIGEWPKMKF